MVAAVLVVASVAAVIVWTTSRSTAPTTPAAGIEPTFTTSTVSAPVTGGPGLNVDPASPKAAAFLDALRQAAVPVSASGVAETEAAAVICEQLAAGTDPQTLVLEVPALLPTVPENSAGAVITAASKSYC